MTNDNPWTGRFIAVIGRLCVVSSVLFITAKVVWPEVDWAVVVSAIALSLLAIRLRYLQRVSTATPQD